MGNLNFFRRMWSFCTIFTSLLFFKATLCYEPKIRCPDQEVRSTHGIPGTSCRQYYVCNGPKKIERKTCPEGSLYSPIWKACQVGGKCQDHTCTGREDGSYADTTEICSRWFECSSGSVVKIESCPVGAKFNEQLGVCDLKAGCTQQHWDGNDCLSSGKGSCRKFKRSAAAGVQENSYSMCDSHATAANYYTDYESGCQSYYLCGGGTKVKYVCPQDHMFNGEKCVYKTQFSCPKENKDCQNRPDGYQRLQPASTNYIFCSKGVKLVTLSCDGNKLYDGERCVTVEQYKSMCHNILFGYITDETCQTYYNCREGLAVSSGTCSNGQIYDGTSCVNRTVGRCSRGSIKSCSGAPNGFYADFDSHCQKYFYCVNGRKTETSCAESLVFNGESCVPKHKHTCPTLFDHHV